MVTTSAAVRREQQREAYDANFAACPSRELLSMLSDKWVVLIMNALAEEPQRYSELRRTIVSISQKMLTQTLRNLERSGMVTRTVQVSVPVTVTYALTELGESLFAVVRPLKEWAQGNIEEVLAARQDYDGRSRSSGLVDLQR